MNRLHSCIAALLIPAALLPLPACSTPTGPRTAAAHESPIPASENAALRYWEAWWELGPEAFPSFFDRMQPVDMETGKPVDQSETHPLSERGIEMLIAATELPRCDFGFDPRAAVQADLPENRSAEHYWLMLKSCSLLLERADKELGAGDAARAAKLYLAALSMIDHAAQQPELVTIGVPITFSGVIDEIKQSQDAFPRSAREILGQASSRFDGEDPFRIVWGLRRIIQVYAESLRRGGIENEEALSPDDLDRIAQVMDEFMAASPEEFDSIWNRLELDKQNPTRVDFEMMLTGLREQQSEALQRLDWLREWSSH